MSVPEWAHLLSKPYDSTRAHTSERECALPCSRLRRAELGPKAHPWFLLESVAEALEKTEKVTPPSGPTEIEAPDPKRACVLRDRAVNILLSPLSQ